MFGDILGLEKLKVSGLLGGKILENPKILVGDGRRSIGDFLTTIGYMFINKLFYNLGMLFIVAFLCHVNSDHFLETD